MDPVRFDIPTELITDRLIIRIPRLSDTAPLCAAIRSSLTELRPWLPWAVDTYDDAESDRWIRRTQARAILRDGAGYNLFDRITGEALGGVGADSIDWKLKKTEIGYWLRTDRAGRGLMTEAVAAVTAALQTLKLRRIQIRCNESNLASAAVARKCGFDLDGVMRFDSLDASDQPCSTMHFSKIFEVGA